MKILGDKKRRNYDPGLVDRVNKQYENIFVPEKVVPGLSFEIVLPENFGVLEHKQHSDWKNFFQEKQCDMISAGELYSYFKLARNNSLDPNKILPELTTPTEFLTKNTVTSKYLEHLQDKKRNILSTNLSNSQEQHTLTGGTHGLYEFMTRPLGRAYNFIKDLLETDDRPEEIIQVLKYGAGVEKTFIKLPGADTPQLFGLDCVICFKKILRDNGKDFNLNIYCKESIEVKGTTLGVKRDE